jgi:hypothetical protein
MKKKSRRKAKEKNMIHTFWPSNGKVRLKKEKILCFSM